MEREPSEENMENVDTMPPPPRSRASGDPSLVAVRGGQPVRPAPRPLAPDLEAMLEHAAFLADQGRFEAAARLTLVCMEEAPLDPRAFLLCGTAQIALGRHALAERLLRRVLMLDP